MTHPAESPRDPGALLGALIDESRQLREDVAERELRQRAEGAIRERRQRNLMIFISAGIAGALILIVCVVVLLVQSRQRGTETRALLRANGSTNQQIADCTTVGKPCYEEGQRRTGEVMRQLLQAQKEISLCRAKTERGSVADLEKCIDTALARVTTRAPLTGS